MQDIIIGTHWSFARGGQTIDSNVVGPDAKPDTDPTANWTQGPDIEQAVVRPIPGNRVTRRAPVNGGIYRPRKTWTLGRGVEIVLSLQQFSPLAFEHLFNYAGPLVADTAAVPGSKGPEDVEIWAKLQMYYDGQEKHNADCWCSVNMEEFTFNEALDPYALRLTLLQSDLNTGVLKNLTEGAATP